MIKKNIKYLIPSIITFCIMAIIFYYNNLYPFGGNALIQVDTDYLYIPSLYKIYDFLHSFGNLFYNDMGLGSSIYGSLIIQGSLFSPLNLLLYLIPRDNIIDYFGLFIIIKLCLISFTSYIYINNKYKNVSYLYKLVFSILYTFNGYIILNYFNDIWLEFVIILPLLVLGLDKILGDDNELLYIIILSTSFIISFYYSMFFIVFILFYSSIDLFLFKRNTTKNIIFKLAKSTIISFLISSFSSLPLLYQIFISGRYHSIANIGLFTNFTMKTLYLLFSPLFILVFIKLVTKYKYDKKNIFKYILLVILYIIPIFSDYVNSLMHGGSYNFLPFRYGFILSFILMDGCLYYLLNFYNEKNIKISLNDILGFILIVLLGILDFVINNYYRNKIITTQILLTIDNNIYFYILSMIALVFLMYIFTYFVKNLKIKKIIIVLVSIFSVFLFTSWTIYYDKYYFLCKEARGIYQNIDLKKDGRYKIDYIYFTPNYGYIFDVPTLDNWLHITPSGIKETYIDLGYHHIGTRMLSTGGTIFSDWLLNFKYNFSYYNKKNDDMFSLMDTYNGVEYKYLYKYNYQDSYGIVFNEFDENLNKNITNKFEYQNNIYHNLFDTTLDIIKYQNYNFSNEKHIALNYEIEKDGYLYMYNYDNSIESISIKGITYEINDFIVYLGYYSNDVFININLKDGYNNSNFEIGFIEKDKIMNLNSNVSYKNNKYYVNSDGEKYLFLPINNINGIHVYNNDKEVKTLKYLDNFISIKLENGENFISINYELPFFKIGVILSFIGIVILFLNNKIKPNKVILEICYYAYKIVIIIVLVYYYVYSYFKYLL